MEYTTEILNLRYDIAECIGNESTGQHTFNKELDPLYLESLIISYFNKKTIFERKYYGRSRRRNYYELG